MISPKRTCDPRMSNEAAMSSVPRTVASLELATILFILNGDRCLQKRPLFPCSPEDILTTARRQRSLVSVTPSVRRSISEEDHFHAILQANFPFLDGVWHCQCHGWLVRWFVARLVLHSRRICGTRLRTGERASAGSTRARPGEEEEGGNVHVYPWIEGGEGRGQEWSGRRNGQRRAAGAVAAAAGGYVCEETHWTLDQEVETFQKEVEL